MLSREARWAVYLVDPGQDRAGVLVLIQSVAGVTQEAAAEYLLDFPSLITLCETEEAARNLAHRFRDFDAVAVVRRADQPLAPAPVEEVRLAPAQRGVQIALVVLALVQVALSVVWFREGNGIGAFFGLILAVYVLLYFGRRLRG